MTVSLLEVKNLRKYYSLGGGFFGHNARSLRAVDDVSFVVEKGETLAIVGESGCGKSTVARTVLKLLQATSGEILLDGRLINNLSEKSFRPLRRHIQVVFQDPYASLNSRMRVRDILAEPIRNFRLAADARGEQRKIEAALDMVKLPHDALGRWPHEFSGGQRQRIGIARALAAEPDLIICDEAVSALDVSVKAQIVNLLQDLQRKLNLALLFISHDLAIVEHLADRVAVMYLGRVVEMGPKRSIFSRPFHPYTQALFSAIPVPEVNAKRDRIVLTGEIPNPIAPPDGCRFHTRCRHAFDRCRQENPALRSVAQDHESACHLHDLPATGQVKPVANDLAEQGH